MQDIYSTNPRTLGRAICIITGASRGFGRALAQEVSYFLKPGSVLLLVARSNTMLQELKEELQSWTEEQQLVVHCIAVDLSTREGVHETVRVARQEAINEMDHVLLINNAGSLGDISHFASFTNLDEVNSYLSLNVSSALALTAGILQVFPCRPGLQWSVVNVSSVFAMQALPSWVLYCTAKAARKMMFGVLAEEEPNVKVLSYSPGPMDTDMQIDIQRLTGAKHHLLPCQESAAKLMKLLLDNNFPSGKHLDFLEV
ncbi:sepiapterin reductase b [Morone saxatilis]|uniref:sepiapterin reductase b n=1 Tax=Morone saxatilis TaxID=34816 RepID=UPI0015E1F158|nr:sepiapterin reductase b [Morone saxatilis]